MKLYRVTHNAVDDSWTIALASRFDILNHPKRSWDNIKLTEYDIAASSPAEALSKAYDLHKQFNPMPDNRWRNDLGQI